jgi:hypothetical protein
MQNRNQCRSCAFLLDGAFCVNKEARDMYMISRAVHDDMNMWRDAYVCKWRVARASWWLRLLNKFIAVMRK